MWKTKFLGTFSRGLFRTPSDRISHIHIVRTSYIQLLARSGIFCFHVEIVYWPCGLKFEYPMINLAFLEIIVKVKPPVKFCLHSFEWFCLQIRSDARYFFLSCPKHCDQGLILVIVVIFKSETKKSTALSLLVVELLALTWVPCILRYPVSHEHGFGIK